MKAVRFYGKEDLRDEEVEEPSPGPGEVKLRNAPTPASAAPIFTSPTSSSPVSPTAAPVASTPRRQLGEVATGDRPPRLGRLPRRSRPGRRPARHRPGPRDRRAGPPRGPSKPSGPSPPPTTPPAATGNAEPPSWPSTASCTATTTPPTPSVTPLASPAGRGVCRLPRRMDRTRSAGGSAARARDVHRPSTGQSALAGPTAAPDAVGAPCKTGKPKDRTRASTEETGSSSRPPARQAVVGAR